MLAAYLSGLVSAEEQAKLERVLTTDVDVRADLTELETAIEQHFLENAVPPPPSVRDALLKRLGDEWQIEKQQSETYSRFRHEPVQPTAPQPNYVNVEVSDTHIRVHKNWRTAFIAIFILAKVCLILGLYYYFKADSQQQEIERLRAAAQQETTLPRGQTP